MHRELDPLTCSCSVCAATDRENLAKDRNNISNKNNSKKVSGIVTADIYLLSEENNKNFANVEP